jgi:hypothetical protein
MQGSGSVRPQARTHRYVLDSSFLSPNLGRQLGFAVGGVLGLGILLLAPLCSRKPTLARDPRLDTARRRDHPRDRGTRRPRYRRTSARTARPDRSAPAQELWPGSDRPLYVRQVPHGLALALMIAQAFLFNAVFFSYGLVLATFHGLAPTRTGLFPLPLAVSNFLGPLLLGPLVDTVGRRIVIAGTYAAGGRRPAVLCNRGALRARRIFGLDPDYRLDADFLLWFSGGEFCLSHSKRNFSPGKACPCDSSLLCFWHRGRRHFCALVVWVLAFDWVNVGTRSRAYARCNADAGSCACRSKSWHRCGGTVPRADRRSALQRVSRGEQERLDSMVTKSEHSRRRMHIRAEIASSCCRSLRPMSGPDPF